jgi:hypothetical protein
MLAHTQPRHTPRYGPGMKTRYETTAYGEQINDLLPGLLAIKGAMTVDDDGMYQGSFTLEPKHGVPLRRALMRVETDLLREDADLVGLQDRQIRTEGQRGADALIRLIQTIGGSAPHEG